MTRVVVTGAGRGIGAALAEAFVAGGAAVVVNDLDADVAAETAARLGAVAVPGDAASREGVAALIEAARAELGGIDVYCANAGVAPGGGAEAPEALWSAAWEVNVMAHVRAAELLLPEWLERGEGRFIATVSAAGLLTMLGSAPYSVSKHAALSFAEWLSATYRHRGVKVHAICPQGVRTQILQAAGEVGEALMGATALEPEAVAAEVLRAIEAERFLILPHPEVAGYYAHRAADPDGWLAAMNHLQVKIVEGRS
ncbi:NAD(P)-dependent dehydrogenase (short-subunit alcohol dehydrogenase family) [Kitasatospora sp. GAS204A]|uniref:SDR family oxidoreductase n=1 Tax=unclassified Kitasatospora TaxID=2633591 RepID=UPI002475AF60|nr:SDR family oxidoreductase [Kitasatospora sp. GAS204B]MDH6116236.1 NAD(P)-dependent dehydrogenase (short-subunit alcohol dehydrogenase family) [Kitasatospora sp. GAS204B]